jgi:hypothetical protein
MRTCPAEGCGKAIPSARAFCLNHWRSLPKPLQDSVWTAWRRRQNAVHQGQAAYQAAVAAHDQAITDAVDFLRR